MNKQRRFFTGMYLVDGVLYQNACGFLRAAKERGFTGGLPCMKARLRRGWDTWDKLLAPVNQTASRNSKSQNAKKAKELADAIAALDARKAAMGIA